MDKIRRISTNLVLLCLGGMTVLVLVAGFVPEPDRQEVRRLLNRNVTSVPEAGPVTRPLSHVKWQMRGLVGMQQAEGGPLDNGIELSSPLSFSDGRIVLRTAKGSALMEGSESLAPLSELLPPVSTRDSSAGEQNRAVLRLGMENLACRLSSPARERLLHSLREWEERRSTQAESLQQRALRYKDIVERNAARFNLRPDLIYAVIYTESSFNPSLISSRNAHGLMQVVPRTAGGEVHAWLGREGSPSSEELLDPETNIRYGTSYLHLLLTRHLHLIQDPRSREYCAIAAYNIGSGAMLRVFGTTRESAFETINTLTPEGVRDKLLQSLPSRETRAFLEKVLASRSYFTADNR